MPLDGVLRVHLLSKENSMEKPGKRIKKNAICSFYFFPLCCFAVRSFVLSLFLLCFVFIFCETISFVKCLSRFCCCLSLFFVMPFFTTFLLFFGRAWKIQAWPKKVLIKFNDSTFAYEKRFDFFPTFLNLNLRLVFFVWFLISFCWVYCGARRIGSRGHNGADFTFNYVARPFVNRGGKGGLNERIIHLYCCTLAIEIGIAIKVEIVTNFTSIVCRFHQNWRHTSIR